MPAALELKFYPDRWEVRRSLKWWKFVLWAHKHYTKFQLIYSIFAFHWKPKSKAIKIHPLGTMSVCIKFHVNPSNRTKVINCSKIHCHPTLTRGDRVKTLLIMSMHCNILQFFTTNLQKKHCQTLQQQRFIFDCCFDVELHCNGAHVPNLSLKITAVVTVQKTFLMPFFTHI